MLSGGIPRCAHTPREPPGLDRAKLGLVESALRPEPSCSVRHQMDGEIHLRIKVEPGVVKDCPDVDVNRPSNGWWRRKIEGPNLTVQRSYKVY